MDFQANVNNIMCNTIIFFFCAFIAILELLEMLIFPQIFKLERFKVPPKMIFPNFL